jgi:hypothetical protein
MWKAIIQAIIAIAYEGFRIWRDRKAVKDTRDAQETNDTRERGTASDVAQRLRQQARDDQR